MNPDDVADLLEVKDQAIQMLAGHPYRALHGVFPILLASQNVNVRGFAFQVVSVIVVRLETQPLPSQRHFDSVLRIFSHWRTEAVGDQKVLDLIDRALASMRVWDDSMAASFWANPYDPVTGDRV